ncbi:hypothetical protein CYD30_27635 [Kosakonia cowanii]|nr:hypothetical protein CYD30_27635 [Kosakonia cowanii]
MVLPSKHSYVSPEIFKKLLDSGECCLNFVITDMFMIAFTCFIVIAQYTCVRNDISQSVFVFMVTGPDRWINFPDNQFSFAVRGNRDNLFHNQFGWHRILIDSLRCAAKDSNKVLVLSTKATLDSRNSGRYTALAAAKSADGRGNPELVTEHNRSCGFFVLNALSHLSMVGRAGQPSGWPVSVAAGISTPVRLTTHERGNSGGELLKLTTEAAIMATIPAIAQPEITVINGQAITTSFAIAEYFHKRHADVLRKIESLECSEKFTSTHFCVHVENIRASAVSRDSKYYRITRDGFAFLAMGFTGKRAAQFKEAYINAFNTMEQELVKSPGNPHQQIHNVVEEARRIQDKLEEALYLWKNHVAPLKPPVLVGGLLLDAVCTADRLVGHAGKLERGEHVREGEVS